MESTEVNGIFLVGRDSQKLEMRIVDRSGEIDVAREKLVTGGNGNATGNIILERNWN